MATILTETGAEDLSNVRPDGDELWVALDDVENAIGWTMKPEGLCQGEVCVPIPADKAANFVSDNEINIAAWWRHMDRPVLHDAAGDTWMFGAGASERAAALKTLQAPDFTLPDLDGKLHSLSDYRGKRVFLTTWASW